MDKLGREVIKIAATVSLALLLGTGPVQAQGLGGSAVVLQLEPADANVASLDITFHRKGVSEAGKVRVPISQ